MENKSYDKRMLTAGLLVLLFCVVCLVGEMSSSSWEAERAKMAKVTSTPTPKVKATSTPKPRATNTPTPTVSKAKNNVKLFFETEKIEITSKEQKKLLYCFYRKTILTAKFILMKTQQETEISVQNLLTARYLRTEHTLFRMNFMV